MTQLVSICVPSISMVHAEFAYSLSQLTSKMTTDGIPHILNMMRGSDLCSLRYNLVKNSIAQNATQILWLDSDIAFGHDLYNELNVHDVEIVACNYAKKDMSGTGTAFRDLGDRVIAITTAETGLIKVDAAGFGAMLVHTEVYKQIPRPWFKFEWDNEYEYYNGEDVFFCELARQYGYDINVDMDVSNFIDHIGPYRYTLKGADDVHSTF